MASKYGQVWRQGCDKHDQFGEHDKHNLVPDGVDRRRGVATQVRLLLTYLEVAPLPPEIVQHPIKLHVALPRRRLLEDTLDSRG